MIVKKGLIVCFVFSCLAGYSQQVSFSLWTNISSNNNSNTRIKARSYLLKQLDITSFKSMLPTKHKPINDKSDANTVIIGIPTPDNQMATFRIKMSDIMDTALEAQFPEIRTFNGQGISDPRATIVLDYNLMGVHAMVLSPSGAYYIDPAFNKNQETYMVYYKSNLIQQYPYSEGTLEESPPIQSILAPQGITPTNCTGTLLRKYRCAIACTAQYAIAATGYYSPTKAQTLSCIQTSFARVVGVYEVEFAITMTLIPNESAIIFTNVYTQPFTGNNNAYTLLSESQQYIDQYIGSANYDIGHTFSTGGGGLAERGAVCQDGYKAQGITGSPIPTGDGYDIDYVAHEMGHEFGASHTFNDNTYGSCHGNYSPTTNNEPGSGSTIMAYAGICYQNTPSVNDNLQPHSDPYFTAPSFDEITAYVTTGPGNTCGVSTSTGNNPPIVALVPDYYIPFKTPFTLLGTAKDLDGDALTYCWEQVNIGGVPCVWNAPETNSALGDAPIFRSFNPVTDSSRTFPRLRAIINNVDTVGEVMPTYARVLKFRLTARDNQLSGGGVCYNENNVNVIATTGAFSVKYPVGSSVSWVGLSSDSVVWNVNGTNSAPINCSAVKIDLSVDGGFTYPYTLINSTPNTGSVVISVPNIVSSQARVRVSAVGNVFFNISSSNFIIKAPSFVLSSFNGIAVGDSNKLSWSTAKEMGTNYFVLERSSDDINFISIDTMPATKNSSTTITYSYVDNNVDSSSWYYRLKMVTIIGDSTFSNIVELPRKYAPEPIVVYPNPSKDIIKVSHSKILNGRLNIFNMLGQLVYSSILNPNETVTQVNVANLCSGLYYIGVNGSYSNFLKTN